MASNENNIQWTTNPVFIKDILRETQLPVLVKVAEGYCGENEDESFSIGDLINLNSVKCIQKVRAVLLTHETNPSEEFFIPLGYMGKVKISCSVNKSFYSVEELLKVFPKYVSVEKDFYSEPTYYNLHKVHIKKGELLELDRFIEGKGLIANQVHIKTSILISVSGKYHFISHPDDNEYTIKGIIEKYPLPQTVSFVGDEVQKIVTTNLEEALNNIHSFSGQLKLLGLSSEDVVVGHYKPLMPSIQEEKFVHRNVILLPMNRTIVKELEVYIPVEKDTENYQMLVARNFSRDLNISTVDSALYVEMAKSPKNMIHLSIIEEKYDTPAPKLPPRRKPGHEKPVEAPDTDEYELVSAPIDANKQGIKRSESAKGLSKRHLDYENLDHKSLQKDRLHKKTSNKLYASFKGLLRSTHKNIDNNKRKVEESEDEKFGEYEELDATALKTIPRANDQDTVPIKPVLAVTPLTRPLPKIPDTKSPHSTDIEGMSVSEVVECLRFCKVDTLADICEKEELDGEFVSGLNKDDLEVEPYCLKYLEVQKFQKIKEGWRPKK